MAMHQARSCMMQSRHSLHNNQTEKLSIVNDMVDLVLYDDVSDLVWVVNNTYLIGQYIIVTLAT